MKPEQLEQAIIEGIDPTRITKRLERAADQERYYSLDPVFYLNKYVHDVASFNFKTKINHAYTVATKDLVKAVRKNNVEGADIDIGEYSRQMIDILTEIRGSAVNNYGDKMGNMDQVVRIINGFEYMSKLGFSVRSGLKTELKHLYGILLNLGCEDNF